MQYRRVSFDQQTQTLQTGILPGENTGQQGPPQPIDGSNNQRSFHQERMACAFPIDDNFVRKAHYGIHPTLRIFMLWLMVLRIVRMRKSAFGDSGWKGAGIYRMSIHIYRDHFPDGRTRDFMWKDALDRTSTVCR